MDPRLLDILCCPTTKVPLRLLAREEMQALNTAIAAGGVHNAAGTRIEAPLAEGLVTRNGRSVYRIDDGIPIMLAEEAISTSSIQGFPAP